MYFFKFILEDSVPKLKIYGICAVKLTVKEHSQRKEDVELGSFLGQNEKVPRHKLYIILINYSSQVEWYIAYLGETSGT